MTAMDRLDHVSNQLAAKRQKKNPESKPFRLTVVGSGNWGSTIAKVVAENAKELPQEFHQIVKMWVFEEEVDGRKLTEIINTDHENVKYLPDVKLPDNIVAIPDIVDACSDADIIIFNIPHQFLPRILAQLKGKVNPKARAISCLKGLEVSKDGCKLLSNYITEELGIYCGALSGANLAPEVARQKWSETTVAYRIPEDFRGEGKDVDQNVLRNLFHRPYFHVRVVDDVAGVSLSGALKNVVAMAAGFVEGLGWGDNAKAAVMRIGLVEMIKFAHMFFDDCQSTTFTHESAGVADIITTCAGGRNVRVGRYMAEHKVSGFEAEKVLLNGQSCQGLHTTKEVYELLAAKNVIDEFPLFNATYQIIYEGLPMEKLPDLLEASED
ncbi:hypothetical protein KL933_001199 [Ogataea haglerorum]|uniref:Glycerol-3-phosphate dehydrogenase [NAD(+)] n=1 Tax=Ogataea haglerorum TaxID=1937702 RepID=A0AAN6D8M4_9ASCO|nr:uncharacterized protein KL911_001855 [Ogataea haglerorum]KAG7699454.1 hypothetical protein KL951_001171 [Ogataea haglerorum]KAG7721120.1 hypothetical protein KL913_000856 [Ogataea haglerorum]KAG7721874.1 hypothetical protein KL949_000852 [Ogataea haglerorum]KAG7730119.1 hypothetical protein KL933_001199 [Ogataea haglerorum]KAG7740351.1 hypothetical protein KL923_002192 [Ogataea haglerorum]